MNYVLLYKGNVIDAIYYDPKKAKEEQLNIESDGFQLIPARQYIDSKAN